VTTRRTTRYDEPSKIGGEGLDNLPGIPSAGNLRVKVNIGAELMGLKGPLRTPVIDPYTGRMKMLVDEVTGERYAESRVMTLRDMILDVLDATAKTDEALSQHEKRARHEIGRLVSETVGNFVELTQSQVEIVRDRIAQLGSIVAYGAALPYLQTSG